jgi:hypothetical protein
MSTRALEAEEEATIRVFEFSKKLYQNQKKMRKKKSKKVIP